MRTAYLGKTMNCMSKVCAVFRKSEDGNRQYIAMEFKRLVDLMNDFLEQEQEELEEDLND